MDTKSYFKDIADSIESGKYFEEAKTWYLESVSFSVVERSYLILFTAISISLILYSFAVILGFRPLAKEVPIMVGLSDSFSEYPRLVPLISKDYSIAQNQDPDEEIQRYFITSYLSARESYSGEDNYRIINKNIDFVREFSIDVIYNSFQRAMDVRNPDSPQVRYRNHTKRQIELKSNQILVERVSSPRKRFTMDSQPLLTYTAKVPFKTVLTNVSGKTTEHWNARIDFLYSPVTYNNGVEDFNKIEFRVINYQVAKVE